MKESMPSMGGEDFSRYGEAGVPICMFKLGSVRQDRLDEYASKDIPPPSLHSPLFYPDAESTLQTEGTKVFHLLSVFPKGDSR